MHVLVMGWSAVSDAHVLVVDGRQVRTMLGLPETFSLYGIDKQISILERRLEIEDLKSPDKLKKHVERFAALWDVGRSSSQPSLVASLFGNASLNGLTDASLAILTSARTNK